MRIAGIADLSIAEIFLKPYVFFSIIVLVIVYVVKTAEKVTGKMISGKNL